MLYLKILIKKIAMDMKLYMHEKKEQMEKIDIKEGQCINIIKLRKCHYGYQYLLFYKKLLTFK